MVARRVLLPFLLASSVAFAQTVNNPGMLFSSSPVVGNCVQATGPNSIATASGPCGTATGSGNVTGPSSSVINDVAAFGNGTGTGIIDTGIAYSHLGILGNTQTWTGANTFVGLTSNNGTTAASSTASAKFSTSDSGYQLSVYPNLVGAAYNPFVVAGDTGVVSGSAPNQSTGLYLGLWNSVGTGIRITPTTITMANRPTFNGNLAWDAGNFNPALYATLAGSNTFSGAVTFTAYPKINAGTNSYLTLATSGGKNIQFFANDTGNTYGYYNVNSTHSAISCSTASDACALYARPTYAGYTPWDTGNFDPTQYCGIGGCAFTGQVSFAYRPTFNGATPWDANNFNPSSYANLSYSNVFTATQNVSTASSSAFQLFNTSTGASVELAMSTNAGVTTYGLYSPGNSRSGILCLYSTDACTFYARPQFGTYTPWDSGNFNPANYLPVTGAVANGAITSNAIGNARRGLNLNWSGSTLWIVGSDSPQTGSGNGGGDLDFYAYGDNGTFLGASAVVTRSSLVWNFSVRPVFGGYTPWDSGNFNPATYSPTTITGSITESQVTNLPTDLAAKAALASPVFTGNPTAPTQPSTDTSNDIATMAALHALTNNTVAALTSVAAGPTSLNQVTISGLTSASSCMATLGVPGGTNPSMYIQATAATNTLSFALMSTASNNSATLAFAQPVNIICYLKPGS